MPPLPIAADNSSSAILGLIERLVPGGQAVYLPIEPVVGAVENECYGNVDRAIARSGGRVQYGWKLWETLPGVMAEAEFHAVWIDPQGEMHEVSPASLPYMDRILFLPDPQRAYSGRQIDNVRIPLQEDPLIDDFIAKSEAFTAAMNSGDLADQHGAIVVTDEIAAAKRAQNMALIRVIEKYY